MGAILSEDTFSDAPLAYTEIRDKPIHPSRGPLYRSSSTWANYVDSQNLS